MLVVDFGAQYAQLIARRVREARVFSEVIPHTASVDEIKARDPQAVVLSGGPASVYAEGAPQLDPALFDLGVPVFGICYGFQAMAQALGGTVAHTGTSEYGRTELKVVGGELHSDLPSTQPVWMSHGDAVTSAGGGSLNFAYSTIRRIATPTCVKPDSTTAPDFASSLRAKCDGSV